jgi:hypothetical protein
MKSCISSEKPDFREKQKKSSICNPKYPLDFTVFLHFLSSSRRLKITAKVSIYVNRYSMLNE